MPLSLTLRARLRAWLGPDPSVTALYGLLEGLRRDFDALAPVLQARDHGLSAVESRVLTVEKQAATVLPNHAAAINDVNLRLTHYERTIPLVARSRKTLVAKVRAEQAKDAAAQALATSTKPAGEGPESEAEMERLETAALDRELRLVREATDASGVDTTDDGAA